MTDTFDSIKKERESLFLKTLESQFSSDFIDEINTKSKEYYLKGRTYLDIELTTLVSSDFVYYNEDLQKIAISYVRQNVRPLLVIPSCEDIFFIRDYKWVLAYKFKTE